MRIFATTPAMLALLATSALAEGPSASTYGASTYKEMAVFNQVVGDARFVGNFMAKAGHCDVTVFETRADDAALTTPLRSLVLPIAAGASGEIGVDRKSALEIACAAGADSIRLAPQQR